MGTPSLEHLALTLLPYIIGLLIILFAIRKVMSWYKRISPNTLAVISGRKRKVTITDPTTHQATTVERGFRWLVGGGTIVWPIFEQIQEMSLNVMQIETSVTDVPDKDGVLVSVGMNANVKVMSDDRFAPLAIESFLGKTEADIKQVAKNTLEGNLRNVVGKLTIEELRQDRQKLMQMVVSELGEDLGKMGLGVFGAQIQTISDKRGYLEAIGKGKTAQTVNAATIAEAEAKRDGDSKSAEARRVGETAQAEAAKAISDANRDRDVAIAENDALVAAKRAVIPIAAEIASANRNAELNKANVEAEVAQVTAGISLQGQKQKLNEAELEATVVTTARKGKEAKIIDGEAEQSYASLTGEASRIKAEKEGQGTQAKQTGEAEGRKQIASALQAELEASAAGEKAGLLAKAAGKQADIEAEAAGKLRLAEATKAQLLAEAEGILKRAEAYKQLDANGRFLLILQALPPIIDSIGIAGEKIVTPMANAIGEGLGNIGEVKIIDMGGNQTGGGNLLTRFGSTPIQLIYQLVEQAKAAGFGPIVEELAKKAGIDLNALGNDGNVVEPVPQAHPEKPVAPQTPAVA